MHDLVIERVTAYLDRVDAALPARVEGFYVVGSTALDAFRPGRSDIDFIAVVADDLTPDEIGRLRRAHRQLHDRELPRALARRQWPLVCNGCYVRWDDLARPPAAVTPIASHVARAFHVGAGFDVNPVTWHTLAQRGIAVRGPAPDALTIHADDGALRRWTLDNLNAYWARWAESVRRPGLAAVRASFSQLGAPWGVLGAPRLHHTIRTGDVISKEAAGEYALGVFDRRWHPVVLDALAYWRGTTSPFRLARHDRIRAADFVAMVVASGNAVAREELA